MAFTPWGTILGSALGIGASIYGGKKASEAMKGVKSSLEGQKAENQNWFDRRYNEDSTQRADAQRVLQHTRELIKQRNKSAAGRQAVMGGTEESVAATKAANAEAMAEAASQIAAAGERRKDEIEQQYQTRKAGLEGQLNQLERDRANAIVQAAGGVASAAGAAGAAVDKDLLEQRKIVAGILK